MDISISGNPGHRGITPNVPYCSDVTITIVELSAANYPNSTCIVDRPIGVHLGIVSEKHVVTTILTNSVIYAICLPL